MKNEIAALIIYLGFSISACVLSVKKKVGIGLTTVVLGFSLLSGLLIVNYDFVKIIRWKGLEIETFERQVDKIKKDALEKIEKQVEKHKKDIENLSTEMNKRKQEVETLSKNTQKYAFFMVDPFNGSASTGGGHARGGSWATSTDIGDSMTKARRHLDEKQYDKALRVADDILKLFPEFPGAVYLKFLAYKSKGNQNEALKFANSLINKISEYGFSEIKPNSIADVYKYVMNNRLQNNDKEGATQIASKAAKYWPDDKDFLRQIKVEPVESSR